MPSPDPKRLAELCKNWGFIDENLTPKTRRMAAPTGTVVEIKRDIKEARQEDILACASACSLSVTAFLAGPKKRGRSGVQATAPRRRVVSFLAQQPGLRVTEKSGRATSIIAGALGDQQSATAQLLSSMVKDGQLRAERNGKRTFSYELLPDGPRVADMMPLEAIPAVNAALPTKEELPPPVPGPADLPAEVPVVDLSGYHPEDIAAALMERVLQVVTDGSQSVHAKVVSDLEVRLAEQVEFGQTEQRRRRRAEEDLAETKADLRRARNEINNLKRARATVPADVVDSILVNGQRREGDNLRPKAGSNGRRS